MSENTASSTRANEAAELLQSIEASIWKWTGSAFLAQEPCHEGDREQLYLELCRIGNNLQYIRQELIPAHSGEYEARLLKDVPEMVRTSTWGTPALRESAARLVRISIEEALDSYGSGNPRRMVDTGCQHPSWKRCEAKPGKVECELCGVVGSELRYLAPDSPPQAHAKDGNPAQVSHTAGESLPPLQLNEQPDLQRKSGDVEEQLQVIHEAKNTPSAIERTEAPLPHVSTDALEIALRVKAAVGYQYHGDSVALADEIIRLSGGSNG